MDEGLMMHAEWSDRFRAAAIAGSAAVWALAAGLLGSGLGRLGDPWSPVGPALVSVAAGAAFAVVAARAGHKFVAVQRAVVWLAAGGWVAWMYADAERHWLHILQVGGWVALGLTIVSLAFPVPDDAPGMWPTITPPGTPKHQDWVERIERLATPVQGPRVSDIVKWRSGFGYRVVGEFTDGTTWQHLQQRASNFASDLRLPHGCGVVVKPGDHRGGFHIEVNTRDAMSQPRKYLDVFPDLSPLSIADPIPFGYEADGGHASAEMRQRAVFLTGEVGSGKTNAEECLNAGLVRCPDVFLCQIDLNGGDMPRQWLTPWIEGRASRPAVGWAATTVDEAVLLTEWAVECALARKTVYADFRRQQNTRLLPVSHDLPLVMIVVDEGGETTGLDANKYLRANLVRLAELGRSMAVRPLFCALRSTSEIVPKQLLVQMGLRIGMQVSEQAEIGRLFDWPSGVDPADIPYVGSGRWRDGAAGGLRPFRTWHTDEPQTIDRIAIACADRRPEMDEPTLAALPADLREAFESRWERVVPAITGEQTPVPTPVAVAAAGGRTVASSAGMAEEYDADAVDRAISRARAAKAAERLRQMPDEYAEREAARLLADLEDERVTPADDVSSTDENNRAVRTADPRSRMRGLLDAAGATGISGPKLLEALTGEGLSVARSTMYGWLAKDAVDLGYGRFVAPHHAGGRQ